MDNQNQERNYDTMNYAETYIPEHMRGAFQRWIEYGISPGSYGHYILSNDLKGALGQADTINRKHIFSTVSWLYNYAPIDCWGSVEAVENWKGEKKK